jgi:hypothetical protein
MKNPFYMPYSGNKFQEAETIYENLDFTGIKRVIEPFCGTSSMSYYIWTKRPDLEFILNDTNPYFKIIFDAIRNNTHDEIEQGFRELYERVKDDKELYVQELKHDNVYSYLLQFIYYHFRYGVFPTKGVDCAKRRSENFKFENFPIFQFYKNANITFTCGDWQTTYEANNTPENMFLFDPPYMMSDNAFYLDQRLNVYEYFVLNTNHTPRVYFIVEDVWVIRLIFRGWKFTNYPVKYKFSHRNTQHCIISQC